MGNDKVRISDTDKIPFIDDFQTFQISAKEDINNLWCRSVFGVDNIHNYTKGEGVNVAVIDTGEPRHRDLRVYQALNLSDTNMEDMIGHSTHVCGILCGNDKKICGVAPNAKLTTIKALDDSGLSSFNTILKSIEWCYENDIHVINMSLGSIAKPLGDLGFVDVINKCVEKGVVLVAAAGNEQGDIANYPANYDGVISVAGINNKSEVEKWCNTDYDFVAPSSAYSTYINGGYSRMRGTSQATAFISGMVCLIKSILGPYTPFEKIMKILRDSCLDEVMLPQPNYLVKIADGDEKNEGQE